MFWIQTESEAYMSLRESLARMCEQYQEGKNNHLYDQYKERMEQRFTERLAKEASSGNDYGVRFTSGQCDFQVLFAARWAVEQGLRVKHDDGCLWMFWN